MSGPAAFCARRGQVALLSCSAARSSAARQGRRVSGRGAVNRTSRNIEALPVTCTIVSIIPYGRSSMDLPATHHDLSPLES